MSSDDKIGEINESPPFSGKQKSKYPRKDTSSSRRQQRRPPKRKAPFVQGSTDQPVHPSDSKRQLLDSARVTAPIKDKFPVFVSTRGLIEICRSLYENIRNRDRQLQNMELGDLTILALQYTILKIMRCDASVGMVDDNLFQLEETFRDIQFPSVICDFIDSIGIVKLDTGLTVFPSLQFLNWENNILGAGIAPYVATNFLHPGLIVNQGGQMPQWYYDGFADLQLPTIAPQPVTCQKWTLMPSVVVRYNSFVPRMCKTIEMRQPSRSSDGQLNMTVSRKRDNMADFICGQAPQIVPEEVARIGAVHGWNESEQVGLWPGDAAIMRPWTTGVTFSLTSALGQIVQKGMKPYPSH